MTTMEGKNIIRKKWLNTNLISLKLLLFFFFGGMGCLFPFLPLHMLAVGLTYEEAKIVSIISPIIAMLGPLLAGPIADKLAGRQGSKDRASTGRYLRVMIATVCILGAIFYLTLLAIPKVKRIKLPEEAKQRVKFSCDSYGAVIFKERCEIPSTCYQWPEIKQGSIKLTNCRYNCGPINPEEFNPNDDNNSTEIPQTSTEFVTQTVTDDDIPTVEPIDRHPESDWDWKPTKQKRDVGSDIKPPHLCVYENGENICHVYTESSNNMIIDVTLEQPSNTSSLSTKWCDYPIRNNFTCRIPEELESQIFESNNNSSCSIECDLHQPYDIPGSVLLQAQCPHVIGSPELTFWSYLVVRSIADIFPTTAVVLLDSAVVIATRETSCGRGDVGRQLAFGSLGFAVFGPLTGFLTSLVDAKSPSYTLPLNIFAAMMIVSGLIAIFANGMPLSPPEWWWHTRSGMLALPMSAVKRYGSETAALIFVLVIMGIFWSAMDTFLPWHLDQLNGNVVLIGVCLTVGALPAIIFLWKSENLVDYCGHSNLLITAFTIYIIRFTGLSLVSGDPWWSLASEILELFTLGIMWVTAILYLRHLVPRHLTVTAQALPVIAHFCIGRSIGAIISSYVNVAERNVDSLRFVYQCMAVASAIIALIYFSLYHALLKPKCHAQSTHGPRQPPTIMEAMNGNGNYTPLRVYHNGRGKKGQFRY